MDITRPQKKRATQEHLEEGSEARNLDSGFRYSWRRWRWQQRQSSMEPSGLQRMLNWQWRGIKSSMTCLDNRQMDNAPSYKNDWNKLVPSPREVKQCHLLLVVQKVQISNLNHITQLLQYNLYAIYKQNKLQPNLTQPAMTAHAYHSAFSNKDRLCTLCKRQMDRNTVMPQ